MVERAGVRDANRLIVDFASAGLVKAYALVIETLGETQGNSVLRGAAIPVDLWHRIVRDGLSEHVWRGGTLRMSGDPASGLPAVNLTGVTFNEKSLRRLINHHCGESQSTVGGSIRAAKPAQEPVLPPAPSQSGPNAEAIPPGAILVTVNQAMVALGLGRTKINELMNDGRLVRRKVDGGTRIEVESIRRLAARSS